MLRTSAPGSAALIAAAACPVSASPASTTVRALALAPCTDSTSDNADGTPLIKVPSHAPPARSASASTSLTTSMLPPQMSGVKISNTDTSKLSDVDTSTLASSPRLNSAGAQHNNPVTFRCSTTTPFGRPVDPDV